ncbi:MAG: hypothetical protein H2069_05980 [Legionella sp.]|nr:hypothetical protein [Legionella sp.]
MHLVEIFLPLFDSQGNKLSDTLFEQTSEELIQKLGGLTAYIRSPAKGFWKPEQQTGTVVDELIVLEIMVKDLSRTEWAEYRMLLEKRFQQEKIIMRAHAFELL